MPNPLYLKVGGITIHEYNAYSPAKKARFQEAARQKLIDLHESDIDAYNNLTAATAQSAVEEAKQALIDDAEDLENS